jgi:hypothetical protein
MPFSYRNIVRLTPRKVGVYSGIIILAFVTIGLLYRGVFVDRFLKGRITKAFAEAYPAYSIHVAGLHYRIWENRLECDSLQIMRNDFAVAFSVSMVSVSGIDRMRLLTGKNGDPGVLERAHADARGVVLSFLQEQYQLRCRHIRISVPESTIAVEQLEFLPDRDDDVLFAGSKFVKTRYQIAVKQCRVEGLACLDLLQRKSYHARAAQINDADLTVLLNKDKPDNPIVSKPGMPNEILSSIKEAVHIDSISLTNGQFTYCERYHVGLEPATLTWDSMQIQATGIGNTVAGGDTAIIQAQGTFLKTGAMNIRLSAPVASEELSFQFSGSLNEMNLINLNPFLAIAERKRFKTGMLHSSSFDINVTNGRASGTVRALYKDLSIAVVEDRTGNESGLGKSIASFIANNIKLRTTNMPDKKGLMKIGKVNYTKKSDETFLKFAWFSLRSGLCDVVGF